MQTQFQSILTPHDAKRHIVHRFHVPGGTTQVHIHLTHVEGLEDGLANMLTLTVFDTQGFRGAGHRMGEKQGMTRVHDVSISEGSATPGYLTGPLPAGDWLVIIDVHRVSSAEPCAYELSISTSADAPPQDARQTTHLRQTRAAKPGWYRGDLHGHTVHSDGRFTTHELLAWARSHQLDFVSLTDHNTVSPLAEFEALATPDLLTMGGFELTTFYGHALAHGVRRWIDWRVSEPGLRRKMPDITRDVAVAGGLFIMAHPLAIGDPICTGCSWTYDDMQPGPARVVEVWNSGKWDDNESRNELALARVYEWLNQGYRLVLTSGTDVHGPFAPDARLGFDVVYADELSERAILDAIRRGHLYLSSGPRVELTAEHDHAPVAMMGDECPSGAWTVMAHYQNCRDGSTIRLVINGKVFVESKIDMPSTIVYKHEFAPGDWVTVEIRDSDGTLAAVTNPIFAR